MNVANNQALVHSMSSDIAWVWVTQDKKKNHRKTPPLSSSLPPLRTCVPFSQVLAGVRMDRPPPPIT